MTVRHAVRQAGLARKVNIAGCEGIYVDVTVLYCPPDSLKVSHAVFLMIPLSDWAVSLQKKWESYCEYMGLISNCIVDIRYEVYS